MTIENVYLPEAKANAFLADYAKAWIAAICNLMTMENITTNKL